jgi:hypothetical protein
MVASGIMYLLWYNPTGEWMNEECSTLLGCYSSREKARAARKQLRASGDYSVPGGRFGVDEYLVDELCWTDGFFTEYLEPSDEELR